MQQTENYKLNLIETTDTFSPAPLNENTDKIEAALAAETIARQSDDAALEQRVTALEIHKIVAGQYKGAGARTPQVFNLGFTPAMVLVTEAYGPSFCAMAVTEHPTYYASDELVAIVPDGFKVGLTKNDALYFNTFDRDYLYIALA